MKIGTVAASDPGPRDVAAAGGSSYQTITFAKISRSNLSYLIWQRRRQSVVFLCCEATNSRCRVAQVLGLEKHNRFVISSNST